MSDRFYNPYQFIPVTTPKADTPYSHINDSEGENKNSLAAAANKFVRHDYWHPEGLSGRIICSLETLSPLIVGANQQKGDQDNKTPGTVTLYFDKEGQPAIPGNSLRGMISHIAEMLSQSALRVLNSANQGEFSVRKQAKGGKGAPEAEAPFKNIGIMMRDGEGEPYIYSLYEEDRHGKSYSKGNYSIPDYRNPRDEDQLRAKVKWQLSKKGQNLNTQEIDDEIARRRSENKKLGELSCFQLANANHMQAEGGAYFIRGQSPKTKAKIRETFIPLTATEQRLADQTRHIPLGTNTLSDFETILRTQYALQVRTGEEEKNHRFLPEGYKEQAGRHWKIDESLPADGQPLVLHGDLVYYRKERGEVVELSYSSIWRKAVKGDLHSSFKRSAGKDILPWNPEREALTAAEALFGVVENEPDEDQRGGARNLASRIRFSDANTDQPIELIPAQTLKILNSPKPPSPAMYFSHQGQFIAKSQLDLNKQTPNGRKHYLPHKLSIKTTTRPLVNHWETSRKNGEDGVNMQLRSELIPSEKSFTFNISFENLSPDELGLLLTSLQPNGKDQAFIHRLGLGKPLGLGHVAIRSAEVQVIDRSNRYSLSGLNTDRYTDWAGDISNALVHSDTLSALQQMMDAEQLEDYPVCYPYNQLITGDRDLYQKPRSENDGFAWFTKNDDGSQGGGRKDFLHRDKGSTAPMKPLHSGKKKNW